MKTHQDFLVKLQERLRPKYMPQANCQGGHDVTHVERLIAIGKKITFLKFNMDEFVTAAWLHNLDRVPALPKGIEICLEAEAEKMFLDDPVITEENVEAFIRTLGLGIYCSMLLERSPFNEWAQDRIVNAVMQQGKKDDELGDSPLLTALRIADKLDRMGPLGIIANASFRGDNLLPYDPINPFGYDSTAEGKITTIYNGYFQILEWYGMLPSDEARDLVDQKKLRFFISFLRMLGEEISEATGAENQVEDDIKKALGAHYSKVLGIETPPEILDLCPGLRQ